jgi:hypothetical protein
LLAQGELGGFEIILPEKPFEPPFEQPLEPALKPRLEPVLKPPLEPLPKPILETAQNDLLWKSANGLSDFYNALQKHSIYTKSIRSLSFCIPKEIKTNAPLLLLFHSPLELTAKARDVLARLFKKLGIDLNVCAISFFLKCNDAALPREKNILKEMMHKEIELLEPEKIIFFREAPKPEKIETPAKADGVPITFAGKPAITLYSLLEMLTDAAGSKEKIIETWKQHLPKSGWFSPDIFQSQS